MGGGSGGEREGEGRCGGRCGGVEVGVGTECVVCRYRVMGTVAQKYTSLLNPTHYPE